MFNAVVCRTRFLFEISFGRRPAVVGDDDVSA